MQDGSSRGKERLRILGAALAVVAFAVAPYLGTLGHGFVHDDLMVVEENPVVRGERWSDAASAPYHAQVKLATGLYRPLTTLTLVLNHHTGALDPRGYHIVNVALHGLAALAVLVLGTTLGMTLPAATLGALLFALHPVHVEGVAYVSGRADVLAALLYLLALAAYVRGRSSGRAGFLVLAGAAFLLALSAKESAVTLPLVVLAWEALLGKGRKSWSLPAIGALSLPLLLYLGARQHALGGQLVPAQAITFLENPTIGNGLLVRWATALAVVGRAAGLLLVPWKLSPDYSYAEIVPVTSPLDLSFLLGLCVVGGLAALVLLAWRRMPRVAFFLLFTALSYSVVSNLVVVIGTALAERNLYLPSVGLCLLAGALLAAGAKRSLAATLVVTTLLLVCAGVRTVSWARVWHDDFTLFSAAAQSAPRSVKVLGNLAVGLAFRGRRAEAQELLERALMIAPSSLPNRFNLAKVLFAQGDLDGAEREFRAVVAADPSDAAARAQLGFVRQRRNDLAGAESEFRAALELDPRTPDARMGLAWVLIEHADLDGAEEQLRRVLESEPRSSAALHGLGVIELRREHWERAFAWLERAVDAAPPTAQLVSHAARALEGMGKNEQAATLYRRALELDASDAEAAAGLARVTSSR